jgi:catechol 2,3-dioxygenase-like lactoylglutathione lyase family enzyme
MRVRAIAMLCLAVLLGASPVEAVRAEPAGHVTGIGGIFFKAKDAKALAAWYRDVLGLPLQPWGGAVLHYDAPDHPPVLTWSAFPDSTRYFAPSTGDFMINYAVDDMDAFFKRVGEKGVTALKRVDDDPNGRFAWIVDPEGNKIELWEPKRTAAPAK